MLELSFNDNNQSNRLPVVPLIPVSVKNCEKITQVKGLLDQFEKFLSPDSCM